jgi:hypothetical protein
MESDTPIGFLEGTGGISTEIVDILHAAGEQHSKNVIFSENPEDLVIKLTKILDQERSKYKRLYKS